MAILCSDLMPHEKAYLTRVLSDGAFPDLKGMFALVDAAWDEHRCDPLVMDDRVTRFYEHPVWLLNGFFIEQDPESLEHRRHFAKYIAGLQPRRVADFGGGYGTLARMIGAICPNAQVHIVEPHPHATAVVLANETPNVRYVSELNGEYDALTATDVFEHVPDPLALVESTGRHLRLGGTYLIANCFWPVIHCHLPSTFHFRWSWDAAMASMNLRTGPAVAYGRAYAREGTVSADSARAIERRSRRSFGFIERLPARLRARAARLLVSGRS